MSELKSIIVLLLKSNFRASPGENKGGKIATYVVLGILYAIMEVAFVVMVAKVTPVFVESGLKAELISAVLTVGLSAVTALGILPMLSTLYFSSDAEFFLSLPVSQTKVYFAKLFTVYLTQLGLTALLALPALITIGVISSLSPLFYIIMFLAVLLLPIFPILISSIICLPLMYLIRFFKNRGAVSSIASLVIFVAFFVVYTLGATQSGDGDVIDITSMLVESVARTAKYFPPLIAISRFATLSPISGLEFGVSMLLDFAIFVLPIVVLFGITVLISRKAYFGAMAAQLENHKKVSKSDVYQKPKSVVKALMLRELKDIVRTPTFALQCFAGLVIAPVFLIVLHFSGELSAITESVEPQMKGAVMGMVWIVMLTFLQMFVVSINVGASTTISRDGNSFFLSKILPVNYKTQIRAKTMLYNIIYGVAAVVCTIIECFIFGFDLWWIALLQVIYLLAINHAFIQLCVCMDLSKPKLDWKSYREIVKNSRNATLPMLIGIAWIFVSGAISLITYVALCSVISMEIASVIAIGAIIVIATAIAIVMKYILNKNLDGYYDRIEG